jgi:thiol-disulfide isomerase/thioredoxin
MEFDNYCIALVVLVLFFLYMDNSLNLEGFASLDEKGEKDESPVMDKIKNLVNKDKLDTTMGVQETEIIGARPKKIESSPPSSMQKQSDLVSSTSNKLPSLDGFFSPISETIKIPKQVPSNLLNIEARFGGQGNLGSSTIGSIGSPAKPTQSGDVSGIPILNNPSIGAPLDYGMNTRVKNIESTNAKVSGASKNLELHMVYTNWCGHSKRALPDFDKVKNEFHGSQLGNHSVKVIKHDADTPEGKKFAKEHNVNGFPTHFILEGERKIEKGIGRTYDELKNKIKSITGS